MKCKIFSELCKCKKQPLFHIIKCNKRNITHDTAVQSGLRHHHQHEYVTNQGEGEEDIYSSHSDQMHLAALR